LVNDNKETLKTFGKEIHEHGKTILKHKAVVEASNQVSADNTKALIQLDENLKPKEQS
jgi:hypothetical protein